MSSRSYRGRHYAGRHRVSSRRARLPRALSSSFVLPTTAAAALVVTATGATVAESAPLAADVPLSLEAYERCALERALREAGGDAHRAARLLGVGRSTLYRKLSKHALAPGRGIARPRDGVE